LIGTNVATRINWISCLEEAVIVVYNRIGRRKNIVRSLKLFSTIRDPKMYERRTIVNGVEIFFKIFDITTVSCFF
jgi:hypothetical protein